LTVRRAGGMASMLYHVEGESRKGKRFVRNHLGASGHVAAMDGVALMHAMAEAIDRGLTWHDEGRGTYYSKAARTMAERMLA